MLCATGGASGGASGTSGSVQSGGASTPSGVSGSGFVGGLGVLPSPSATPWVPLLSSTASGHIGVSPTTQPSPVVTSDPMPVPPVVTPFETVPGVSVVPAGSFMAEGLLPVPEILAQKIIHLEFIKMRELMPETWWPQ